MCVQDIVGVRGYVGHVDHLANDRQSSRQCVTRKQYNGVLPSWMCSDDRHEGSN